MGFVSYLALLVLLPLLFLSEPVNATTESGQAPIVILISWDGMRHDYPERDKYPGLIRMIEQGTRAQRLIPVYPSDTFPGHVSIATGTYPDVHGIVSNTFYDRKLGAYDYDGDAAWIMAEPLWAAAERQGIATAVYFWVGSDTPWRGQAVTYLEAPFDTKRKESAKVKKILEWLELPEAKRPRLIMSYWRGTDYLAHRQGPDHKEITRQIDNQDKELQRLIEALDELGMWPRTTLLLVSDHGMAEIKKFLDIKKILSGAKVPMTGIRITGGASLNNVYIEDAEVLAQAEQILQQHPALTVHKRAALNPDWRLNYADRTGDLVVTTTVPYSLVAPTLVERTGHKIMSKIRGWRLGMHGYDPMRQDMGGVFIAMGRGVTPGTKLGDVRQIDVAVTVAALLGMEPPAQAEGKAVLGTP